MTNDKAERQIKLITPSINIRTYEWGLNLTPEAVHSFAGEIVSLLNDLSELQPVNKTDSLQGVKDLLENMDDIDPEIQAYVDDHFWEMLDSRPVNKTDEELTETLRHILIMNGMEGSENIQTSIREITSILPRREADKNLLEALYKIMNLNTSGEITGNESWFVAQEAIKNYRK